MKTTLIAVAVMMASGAASATSKDCGCTKTPTAYDKTQDVKISGNTSAIGDVKLTAGQAFDIAVEGRATADNALTTVYGLIPQVNNNAKGIADLQETKLDKSVFTADQQRQDKALNDAVSSQSVRDAGQDEHINAVQGAAQSANDRASNLEVRADASESAIRDTQNAAQIANDRAGNLEVRADAAEGAIRETNAQMEYDRQQSIDRDAVNAGAITAESQARAEANVKLAAGISTAQSTGDYAVSRSDAALRNAATNAQAIRSTNAKVAEHSRTLANHEQRLTGLEQQTNRNFASLGQRIDKVQDKANAGTATALAASGIPQVTGEQRFSLGAAVGGYESEQAIAVGFSSRVTENVVIKASVATDSQHGVGYNLGTSIGW